nr:proteasome ATPase [Bifidobacterium aemilianum]
MAGEQEHTGEQEQSPEDLAQLNDRLMAKNHSLTQALTRAGSELTKVKSQLSQLAQPPLSFATMVRLVSVSSDEMGINHATAEVLTGGRRLIVPVAATVKASSLRLGASVLLNENLVLVRQSDLDGLGQVRSLQEVLEGGRLLVADAGGNLTLVRPVADLADGGRQLNAGDRLLVDPSGRLALEALPAEDEGQLLLEETPDVTFDDIGGLDQQISRIRDAVQLPFLHADLFSRFDLQAPKGVLLYGPPGNGKTLIAKALANELSQGKGAGSSGVFLSVKGPELLNKFVGESERLVRLIFRRARELAAAGRPVVVFIDEMDALLRTRGSGVSSDVETTIVPQFLTEMDGVESLGRVLIIGASNRVDMLDPAVLRPGRFDVKIRVDRPGPSQGLAIVRHYLGEGLPVESGQSVDSLAQGLIADAYGQGAERRVCQVCDDQGVWSPVHLADLMSGAMLRNMVDRAKTKAVKASILQGTEAALTRGSLARAVQEEFLEACDAVLDANPLQWSRVNGIAGGRVQRIVPSPEPSEGTGQ